MKELRKGVVQKQARAKSASSTSLSESSAAPPFQLPKNLVMSPLRLVVCDCAAELNHWQAVRVIQIAPVRATAAPFIDKVPVHSLT
jgi:hypothetical protein